jgi:hypothetical protein
MHIRVAYELYASIYTGCREIEKPPATGGFSISDIAYLEYNSSGMNILPVTIQE